MKKYHGRKLKSGTTRHPTEEKVKEYQPEIFRTTKQNDKKEVLIQKNEKNFRKQIKNERSHQKPSVDMLQSSNLWPTHSCPPKRTNCRNCGNIIVVRIHHKTMLEQKFKQKQK